MDRIVAEGVWRSVGWYHYSMHTGPRRQGRRASALPVMTQSMMYRLEDRCRDFDGSTTLCMRDGGGQVIFWAFSNGMVDSMWAG